MFDCSKPAAWLTDNVMRLPYDPHPLVILVKPTRAKPKATPDAPDLLITLRNPFPSSVRVQAVAEALRALPADTPLDYRGALQILPDNDARRLAHVTHLACELFTNAN